jgi:ribonuclease HI
MGDKLVDYMIREELICCNNWDHTRVSRITGALSAPDVTMVTKNLQDKFEWNTENDLGSDHLPIIIEMKNGKTRTHQTPKKFRNRWKRGKVDWTGFQEEIEQKLNGSYRRNYDISFDCRVKRFTDILINAGYNNIGKTAPRTSKIWLSPAVKTAIKKRNNFRRDLLNKRREWLESCKEVSEMISEEKEKAWIDYLDDMETNPDPARVWRTIKSLSGSPDSPAPNEVLIHKGKAVTTAAKKADLFAKHYANVSSLKLTKEERTRNKDLKNKLKNWNSNETNEACKDLELGELRRAIKSMRANGAAGNDDIPPTFLKNLGEIAMEELLAICNHSFKTAEIPAVWRHAIIIPILKKGKPSSKMDSYRPISLTSCVAKTLERMINNRIYYIAETKGWLSKSQTGFRKLRSTEDQVIRITQSISDSFQSKPAKRTMMVLIDYSKAYDRVWRQDLLLDMIDLGLPMQLVKWVSAFINRRTAQVKYNGVLSRKVVLQQGLPQGAVLSPLLFLFYINGLSAVIPEDIEHAMFADDASIWAAHEDLNVLEDKLQRALDKINEWSTKKKMTINFDKCEATFFSNDSHEAKWRPDIKLRGAEVKDIKYEASPKFLGVYLDRTLSFTEHVLKVVEKVGKRNRILSSLSTKIWGWKKKKLAQVYHTMQKSVLDYAAPGWQPYLSETQMNKLEVAQNSALRIISGQYKSTPVEALRLETGVQSYRTTSKQLTAKAYEKALRLPADHPRAKILAESNHPPHRTKKSSWRKEAQQIIAQLPICALPRKDINTPLKKPWSVDSAKPNWRVITSVDENDPGVTNLFNNHMGNTYWNITVPQPTADNNPKSEQAIRSIDNFGVDTIVYTDGSCKGGTEEGGSAAVITTGSARHPVVIATIQKKGAKYTCSFEEEKQAMILALNWIVKENNPNHTVICSDSQSLLKNIDSGAADLKNIFELFALIKGSITLQWVPSHVNVPGNELADQAAKAATLLTSDEEHPITYTTAKALIERMVGDPKPKHNLVKETYKFISLKRDEGLKCRKDAALIAQLRTGHCRHLATYRHRIDDTKSPICSNCDEEDETVIHWLKCPATILKRIGIFGKHNISLGTLTQEPLKVLAFAKATLKMDWS